MDGTSCGAAAKPRQDGADQQTTGSNRAELEDKTPAELSVDHSGVGQCCSPHNALAMNRAADAGRQRQKFVIAASTSMMWS
jgi:hypothetical protein